MRTYNDRAYKHNQRHQRLKANKGEKTPFWILESGKALEKHDVWKAFDTASKLMGRRSNSITPHWLRHTFATWTIMDIAYAKNIQLENSGTSPNPLLIVALQQS